MAGTEQIPNLDTSQASTIHGWRLEIQRLDALEVACDSKFAVTQCQESVQEQRRSFERLLRQEERTANDGKRLKAAQENLLRIQEKALEHERRLTAVPHLEPAKRPEVGSGDETPRVQTRKLDADHLIPIARTKSPQLSQHDRIQNRLAYERKLRAAQEKRLEVSARVNGASKTTSKLPTPP